VIEICGSIVDEMQRETFFYDEPRQQSHLMKENPGIFMMQIHAYGFVPEDSLSFLFPTHCACEFSIYA
jgi:hypothetical protein